MTAIEALEALNALNGTDNENLHSQADAILIAFLEDRDPACADVARAWKAAEARVGFWYA